MKKVYGVVVFRWDKRSSDYIIDHVRVFESKERRDKLDHALLMKGHNYETFESEVEE